MGPYHTDTVPHKLVECPAHLTSASDGIIDWASSSFIVASFEYCYYFHYSSVSHKKGRRCHS